MTNKVGFWWTAEKERNFNVEELKRLFGDVNLDFVKIDPDVPLEEQGPFKAIIHKLAALTVKAGEGDTRARVQVQNFTDFFVAHPETIVVDSLQNIDKLLDRYNQYRLLQESPLKDIDQVLHLGFAELTSTDQGENLRKLKEAGVQFPMVCKPSLAQGSAISHQMCLIFGESGLKDIKPPCVAQTFINHNAVLYKLFVLGNHHYAVKRPSLKNFRAGDQSTIFFHSHDISKSHSVSSLNKLDEEDRAAPVELDPVCVEQIVSAIMDHFGLYLFGADLIVDNATGRYAIIDVNTFPNYSEVEDFSARFRDLIVSLIPDYQSSQNDSGIETSDSADEKKSVNLRTCKRSHSRCSPRLCRPSC